MKENATPTSMGGGGSCAIAGRAAQQIITVALATMKQFSTLMALPDQNLYETLACNTRGGMMPCVDPADVIGWLNDGPDCVVTAEVTFVFRRLNMSRRIDKTCGPCSRRVFSARASSRNALGYRRVLRGSTGTTCVGTVAPPVIRTVRNQYCPLVALALADARLPNFVKR